jgi:hypothetical protein
MHLLEHRYFHIFYHFIAVCKNNIVV